MLSDYLIALSSVFLGAISQLLLKLGALHGVQRNSTLHAYLNPKTLVAYALLFTATLLSTYAYQTIPLKAAVFLLPTGFVSVALLSCALLHESFTRNQQIGSAVILLGIVVFNL